MGKGRKFFDWSRPALDRAVELLTEGWSSGPLDLRHRMIIVPTRHAGRRLRERLAQAAAAEKTGVLIGHVETPSVLFRPVPGQKPIAADIAAEVFWRRVFVQADPASVTPLCPPTISAHASSRPALATHIASLRNMLCEEGYTLASYSEKMGEQNAEPERWACLARLERDYGNILEREGWRDDVDAKLSAAHDPILPAGITHVTVLFAPDPPPLALRALEVLRERKVVVEIAVHAPEELAGTFDTWGRPIPKFWEQRPLSLEPAQVEVCDDVTAEAERVRALVADMPPDARAGSVVGVGDSQTVPRIAMALARDGIGSFDPSGTPASRLPIFTLVDRLLRLRQDGRVESLFQLLRHPYALRRLECDLKMENDLLGIMDEFQNQQMPVSFDAAIDNLGRFTPQTRGGAADPQAPHKQEAVKMALASVQTWLSVLDSGPFSESLPALLETIFMNMPASREFEEEARKMTDTLVEFAPVEKLCAPGEAVDILRKYLSAQTLNPHRAEHDLDLLGWLELGWEDAPTVLLTDLNDGVVPEAITADTFLPDGARAQSGMRDNRHRLARDAYLLETIVHSRSAEGRVRGFMARRGGRGDPLKPSRLLFQCPDDQLADRALYFFSDGPPSFRSVQRSPGWKFRGPDPTVQPPLESWSASRFKTYLECPFQYYLRYVARLRDPFAEKAELDPLDFGKMVHAVFQSFSASAAVHSSDPAEIERTLHAALDQLIASQFGRRISLPLEIQRDVLRQRLSHAAKRQAEWRGRGWKIRPDCVELSLDWTCEGNTIRGRLDRVDVDENTGAVCVMDYKTVGDPRNVELWHAFTGGVPDELDFARAPGDRDAWVDLQLPLYIRMCQSKFPDAPSFRAAHFILPNAVTKTQIMKWDELDESALESAMICARRIIARIRAGVFWPPRKNFENYEKNPEYRLFFGEVEKFVDEETLRRLRDTADAYLNQGAKAGEGAP